MNAGTISVGSEGSLDAQGSSLDDMTSLDDDGEVNLTTPQPGNIGVLVPITLSGAGTLTIDGGTLNLAGADTYVGATAIHSGTLLVTNSAGSATGISTVSVGNGASLDGSGNAGGSVSVAAGGTVDPGDGMLTSVLDTGSVSFADGSNFNVTINNSTTNSLSIGYDQLKVTGNMNIASLSTGATLNLSGMGNTAAGDQLIIAQCTGSLTGTFANATPGTIVTVGNESYSVSYTSSEMILTDVTPAAPTLVSASAASSSEIDLAWTNNDANAAGYEVLMSTDGVNYFDYDSVLNSSTITYQATGLGSGTLRYFEVEALEGTVPSAPSNAKSATTQEIPSPQDLTATAVSPNEVDLGWTGFSEPNAVTINIYISTDGVNFTYFDSVDSNVASYNATGLIPGTTYSFEVTAADANDNESTPSNIASATTAIDPWNVSVTGGTTANENQNYQLTFSSSPIAGAPAIGQWLVDWGDGTAADPDVIPYPADSTSVTHTFAAGTSSAVIQVSATTSADAAVPLTVTAVPINVDVIPTAATNLQVTVVSSTEVDLTWTTNSTAASGYDILSSVDGGAFTSIGTVDGSTDSYDDTSLSPSETVAYEAEPIGASGDNTANAPASTPVTTPTGMPAIASLVQGSDTNPTDASATLTWTYQGTDYSGFEVEMKDTSTTENFHTVSTDPTVTVDNSGAISVATGTFQIGGLIGGDTYQFRIRADHSDGSVSDYVTSDPLQMGQAAAPRLTVTPASGSGSDYVPLMVSWSGAAGAVNIAVQGPALPGGSQWYGVYDGSETGDWPTEGNGEGLAVDPAAFGTGSYTYKIRAYDAHHNLTQWSEPQSGTYYPNLSSDFVEPTAPGKPVLTSDDTTITATWPVTNASDYRLLIQADGVDGSASSSLDDHYFNIDTPVANGTLVENSAGTEMTETIPGLTPGTQYDIDLWAGSYDYSGAEDFVFAKTTATTTGTAPVAPPAAPNSVSAKQDAKAAQVIHVHWVNSPNNETGFIVSRSINGLPYQEVGHVNADITSFDDSIANLSPTTVVPGTNVRLNYEVTAVNGSAPSTPAVASLGIIPVPFRITRTVRSTQVLHNNTYNFIGFLAWDLVKIVWDETIYDEFGNPMPNLPFREVVTVLVSHFVYTPPIINKAAITGLRGLFMDESRQTFMASGGFIALKQRIIAGGKQATFLTFISDTGSTAGSTFLALFR